MHSDVHDETMCFEKIPERLGSPSRMVLIAISMDPGTLKLFRTVLKLLRTVLKLFRTALKLIRIVFYWLPLDSARLG